MNPSLYIHIPFCLKKCAYCDFYSVTDLSLMQGFLNALLREIRIKAEKFSYSSGRSQKTRIRSLYLGGGTPSVLPCHYVETLLRAVDEHWLLGPETEITFEVNPGTADREYLSELKKTGINRLSIGVQSFDDNRLAFLGRIHDGKQAKKTIETAWNLGFENLGADIIYGIPSDKSSVLEKDLVQAAELPLNHASCYMLTIEPGTPMYNRWKQEPDSFLICPEKKMRVFEKVSDILENHGFVHYEVSNFARGMENGSVHNQGYWNGSTYLGLGPSAHSFFVLADGRQARFWNGRNLRDYIFQDGVFDWPVGGTEILTRDQQIIERIMLGLRTRRGIDLTRFYQDFGSRLASRIEPFIREIEEQGLGKKVEKSVRGKFYESFFLTTRGWTCLDNIVEVFVKICL